MNRVFFNRRIACCALSLFAAPCVGCQHSFTVKVEKLAGSFGGTDSEAEIDEALETVHAALSDVDGVCNQCRAVAGDVAMRGPLAGVAEAQMDVQPLLQLTEDLRLRRNRGQLSGRAFAARVDALRKRAIEILPKVDTGTIKRFSAHNNDPGLDAAVESLSFDAATRVQRHRTELELLTIDRPGFGGFRQAGVYVINPGDPAYEAVLKAKPAPNPLTSVTVRATGDSGIMVVQESPGQMRLYQLTNDPISLMRNVGFILDKVLQAAVKFGSPIGP